MKRICFVNYILLCIGHWSFVYVYNTVNIFCMIAVQITVFFIDLIIS